MLREIISSVTEEKCQSTIIFDSHFCMIGQGYYHVAYFQRGPTRPGFIITSTAPPDIFRTSNRPQSADVVDSAEPVIRKTFPESWIFDSFDGSSGYLKLFKELVVSLELPLSSLIVVLS
jgi:hypothetical protein